MKSEYPLLNREEQFFRTNCSIANCEHPSTKILTKRLTKFAEKTRLLFTFGILKNKNLIKSLFTEV